MEDDSDSDEDSLMAVNWSMNGVLETIDFRIDDRLALSRSFALTFREYNWSERTEK